MISTLYREMTDDEIKAPARILGGGLFGGIIGAIAGLANAVLEKLTGKDVGAHVMAWFKGDDVVPEEPMLAGDRPKDKLSASMDDPVDSPADRQAPFPEYDHLPPVSANERMRSALDHYRQVGRTQGYDADPEPVHSGYSLDLIC